MPDSNPPPPSGAMIASTSGRSSRISSPAVALPAMNRSSSNGWLKHFELQVDLDLRVRLARSGVCLEPDERRADRSAVHGERGVADGGERNAATRNSDGQGG